ncbi:MAG: class I SAM-dependent methyltransferase [Solirubrobacteraceae bacterium]
MALNLWGRAFAALYDLAMANTEQAGLADRRRELLAGARGAVLELGAGTGVNLAHYPGGITELVLAEPEEPMARRLRARAGRAAIPLRVLRAPAESLPLPDSSFDAVVCTLVLCTVDDPAAALAECARVLRPGGHLLFLEHVRATEPRLARRQDLLHPLWVRFGHGCHCNRDTVTTIRSAGFELSELRHERVPRAPSIVRPLVIGSALAPAPAPAL